MFFFDVWYPMLRFLCIVSSVDGENTVAKAEVPSDLEDCTLSCCFLFSICITWTRGQRGGSPWTSVCIFDSVAKFLMISSIYFFL